MENKLPEGWELVELKDYVYFQEGPGIRKWQFRDKGIKLLNVRNLVNGELNLNNTERYVSEEEIFEKYEHFLLNPDEIVMASSGVTWGKTALVRSEHLPLILNTSTIRFRSLDCKILDQNYLLNFLNSELFKKQIERLITGSAQPNFGPSHLIQVKLFLPPLETQQKIVAILEKAEETKKLRAQADDLTQKLLQSVFLEMFGDPMKNPKNFTIVKLSDVSEVSSGLTLNSQRSSKKESLFPYLRVANVYRNRLDLSEIKNIHISGSEIDRYMLKKEDVLIVEGHGNIEEIGRAAVWNEEIANCVHQNHIIKVRLNENYVRPYFVSYFLNMYGNKGYFYSKSRTTSGLNTISTNKVRDVEIFLPPIDLQSMFEKIVLGIEKTQQSQKQSSLETNNLFDALMQKAFTGELVS